MPNPRWPPKYHLGFVEFLDFDKCNTETRVIPPIPLILRAMNPFLLLKLGLGVILMANLRWPPKITSAHWSPIKMMPARLSNTCIVV